VPPARGLTQALDAMATSAYLLALIATLSISNDAQASCHLTAQVIEPVERTDIRFPPINPRSKLQEGIVILDIETTRSGAVEKSAVACATADSLLVRLALNSAKHWLFQPGEPLKGQVLVTFKYEN
jgi:outer membrane biosynthesis protein TonB